jgi:predicted DNA-binding transcriptional regulator AlpA
MSLQLQRLLRPAAAAKVLDLSPSTLAKKRMTGDGPRFVKLGGAVRYDLKDLQEFVARSVRHSTSDQGGCADP